MLHKDMFCLFKKNALMFFSQWSNMAASNSCELCSISTGTLKYNKNTDWL